MSSTRHFALSFFGPVVAATLFCGLVFINWKMLEEHRMAPLVTMLVGALISAISTRWAVRAYVAVRCPFCGGKSYEIPARANRFMCRVCGKDH